MFQSNSVLHTRQMTIVQVSRYNWDLKTDIHRFSNNFSLCTYSLTLALGMSKVCAEYGSPCKSKPGWIWHPVLSSSFLFPNLLQYAVFAGICSSILLTVSLVWMSLYESVYSPALFSKWAWVNVVVLFLCVLWHCLDCKTDFHPLRELPLRLLGIGSGK